MRRLILKMSVTLDGFVCGPNGEVDWLMRHRDAGATEWIAETLGQAGLHAMGRQAYLGMAIHWPTATGPLAAAMNAVPKVVFTRQASPGDTIGATGPTAVADPTGWADPLILNGDLATEIARLKQMPGKDILAHGGAGFAQSLSREGLVDDYRLLVHPVALGAGLPLFAGLAAPVELTLVSTTPFRSGVIAQVYRSAA